MQNKLPNLFQKNNQHQKNQGKRNPFQNNKFQLRKKNQKSGKRKPCLRLGFARFQIAKGTQSQ